MTCFGSIESGSARICSIAFSVIVPGTLVTEDRDAADGADVDGAAVDVRRDDAGAAGDVQRVAGDQARDSDRAVRLGEVLDHRQDANVELARRHVAAPGRVDRHAGVVQHLLLQSVARGLEAVQDRREPQRLDVGGERHLAVARLDLERRHGGRRGESLCLGRLRQACAAAGDPGELEVTEQRDTGGLGLRMCTRRGDRIDERGGRAVGPDHEPGAREYDGRERTGEREPGRPGQARGVRRDRSLRQFDRNRLGWVPHERVRLGGAATDRPADHVGADEEDMARTGRQSRRLRRNSHTRLIDTCRVDPSPERGMRPRVPDCD